MVEVVKSVTFDRWVRKLKDRRAAARVLVRIDRLAAGNSGDVKARRWWDFGTADRPWPGLPGLLPARRTAIHFCCSVAATSPVRTATSSKRTESPRSGGTMNTSTKAFSPYDSADYLVSVKDAAAYLEAALEEGGDDPAFVALALGTIARSGNVSELARRAGMSREGLYKALSGDGNPSFATIMKVAKALGLRLHFESVA
jgi:probable addiction module antidote protein